MATDRIDMSLDDIIKQNKSKKRGGGARGGRGGRGRGVRRGTSGDAVDFGVGSNVVEFRKEEEDVVEWEDTAE